MSRGRVAAIVVIAVLVPLALLGAILVANRDDGRDADASTTTMPTMAGNMSEDMPMPEGAVVAGKADVGATAPDFMLPEIGGGNVRLSELRGTPVVVTFYASWCYECTQELPRLQQMHTERGDDVAIVGVSYRDLFGDARDFVDDLGVTYPMLHDDDNGVAGAYGVRAIPQTFFIDADGVIRAREFGVQSEDRLDERVDEIAGPAA
jgi:cytochrome c biogenesis protein CcmG, thiol:disulfide interchange protein DsbE